MRRVGAMAKPRCYYCGVEMLGDDLRNQTLCRGKHVWCCNECRSPKLPQSPPSASTTAAGAKRAEPSWRLVWLYALLVVATLFLIVHLIHQNWSRE
jgi:hypothetical protein